MAEKTEKTGTEKTATEPTPQANAAQTREEKKIEAFVLEFGSTPKQMQEMREALQDERTTTDAFVERFMPHFNVERATHRAFRVQVEKVVG